MAFSPASTQDLDDFVTDKMLDKTDCFGSDSLSLNVKIIE